MAQDVTIPQIGESVATVFISQWLVKPGQAIDKGAPLLEIDSDKASMEVPSPISGAVVELLAEEGDEVDVGSVVARIEEGAEGTVEAPADEADGAGEAGDTSSDAPADDGERPQSPDGSVAAGPAARAEATSRGVDLRSVSGSGKGGRVTSADVRGAGEGRPKAAALAGSSEEAPAPARGARTEERKKMTPLRRTIARRLVEAQQTAAMLTTFNEVDMSAVMALRARYKQGFLDRHDVKLGFMGFFVKAVVEALKAYPSVNAQIDGDEVVYKHYYDIGIAVSGPKGLVVPVLRDADRLGFADVEKGIGALARKARDNKLQLADFQGGTFTITNGGIFGSMMSTPILNPPQVGILGMHNIVERAVVVDGEIVVRPMMYLALSYDHRLIDGREAVSFLVRIKECIEDPERILLDV